MPESAFPTVPALGFDPAANPREQARHYIPASQAELTTMLQALGLSSMEDLYAHLPEEVLLSEPPALPEELSYEQLQSRMAALAAKNRPLPGFLGDGLHAYSQDPMVDYVASLRQLTTAYTPYQPERSQGTLLAHWVYQCVLAKLTGFEAINSSLYDRATALFEALATATRLARKANTAVLPEAFYPGDREVLETLAADTPLKLHWTPLDPATGRIDLAAMKAALEELGSQVAVVAFPQVNSLGFLEDVDALTDLAHEHKARALAVIDPVLLATGGLKPPVAFGQEGADMLVGEAQPLALAPNFGGPGLGLFGIRHHANARNDIRQTPGRYVGKARDIEGRPCNVMVLSTREQHIRKDKATSNICSNQAFLATMAGAAVLARGEEGMAALPQAGYEAARIFVEKLSTVAGVALAFPNAPFWNELTLALPGTVETLQQAARKAGLHAGVEVSERLPGDPRSLIKLTFTDLTQEETIVKMISVLQDLYGKTEVASSPSVSVAEVPATLRREGAVGLPSFGREELKCWYASIAELNASPDDAPYPLGSCTMKYNPYINDWAAGLSGFTQLHPQAPVEDAQGALEILYETQEWIRKITGLAGVTTQPVAGAQGELVGLKLFQAYLRDHGQGHRDLIFIPDSAHGTNFATAVMAGFRGDSGDATHPGIVLLRADASGRIDRAHFDACLAQYGDRVAGMMVTNPNTTGLFETEFREIAHAIREAGGLVYMDGANTNAIAGWTDLQAMGVDAVHHNLHKTWTIPHGGGGPGDAIVAVSERLLPYLPGWQIEKRGEQFVPVRPEKSIGSFHRHWGNFAHKVRAMTYLLRLGREGVPQMAAVSVLSARYLQQKIGAAFPSLPEGTSEPRMHEFILTLRESDFERLEAAGIPRNAAIARLGKLFLDLGYHAPTMSWPETFGMMLEPTESYTQAELDRLAEAVRTIGEIVREHPEVLQGVPYFTPVSRIEETEANRKLVLHEELDTLPQVHPNRMDMKEQQQLSMSELKERLLAAAGKVPAMV